MASASAVTVVGATRPDSSRVSASSGDVLVHADDDVTITAVSGYVEIDRLLVDTTSFSLLPTASAGIPAATWYMSPPCRTGGVGTPLLYELKCVITLTGATMPTSENEIIGTPGQGSSLGIIDSTFTILTGKMENLALVVPNDEIALGYSTTTGLLQGADAGGSQLVGGGAWTQGELRPLRPIALTTAPGRSLYFTVGGDGTGGVIGSGYFLLTILATRPE